jgi:hypothetical protein
MLYNFFSCVHSQQKIEFSGLELRASTMDFGEIVYHLIMKEIMESKAEKTQSQESPKNSFEHNTNGAKAPQSPTPKSDTKERFVATRNIADIV